MNYPRIRKLLIGAALMTFLGGASLYAHCEIPCGIYNDQLRIDLIKEHITTIEKSMNQINELSNASPVNYNQLVRWVGNKEDHANELQHIVTQYFMTQRIKPADPGDEAAAAAYTQKVTLLHQLLVYAMKAKQTTDLANIEQLRGLTDQFYEAYFGKTEKEHLEEHKN